MATVGIAGDPPTGACDGIGADDGSAGTIGARSGSCIAAIGGCGGWNSAITGPIMGGSGAGIWASPVAGTPAPPTAMGSAIGTGAGLRSTGDSTVGPGGVWAASMGVHAAPGSNHAPVPDMPQGAEIDWG